MNITHKQLHPKLTIDFPNIPDKLKEKSKKTAVSLAQTLAIFNAAGGGKRKKDILAWGENRRYYIRHLFYLYLFNKYKNSCISVVSPSCTHLRDICRNNGMFELQLYAFQIPSGCGSKGDKRSRYEDYLREFSREIVKCLKKRGKIIVIVPVILAFKKSKYACESYGTTHANLLIFRKKKEGLKFLNHTVQIFKDQKPKTSAKLIHDT